MKLRYNLKTGDAWKIVSTIKTSEGKVEVMNMNFDFELEGKSTTKTTH